MRNLAIALAATALLAAPAHARPTPQEQLAKAIEGRVAGSPVECISLSDARDMTVIDKTAIVWRTGAVVYVNVPKNPETLDSDDILVTRPTGSQLCRLDLVNTVDRSGHYSRGFVSLGRFVPYRKAPAGH